LTRVAIALGSNLGDRESLLEFARRRLRTVLTDFTASNNYETVPVGMTGHQPMFLNAAVTGVTTLRAQALLSALHAIEQDAGRERPYPGAARTLDLDLILYGDDIVDRPGLRVPHPRFRERLFVLEPLSEIAPDLRDPESGQTIEALTRLLRDRGGPRR
jgi:2-amino-4-hydroxy-6-hydroxymethyldihydropteridine diphosphokinase